MDGGARSGAMQLTSVDLFLFFFLPPFYGFPPSLFSHLLQDFFFFASRPPPTGGALFFFFGRREQAIQIR